MSRILHVTECYAGGISRAITTAISLTPHHEHHLLWSGNETPDSELFASVTALPSGIIGRANAVRDQVYLGQPDIVFAHSSWAGVYTRMLRQTVPVVYEPHCYKFEDEHERPSLRRFYWLAEKLLANRNAITVVLSPHEERLAKKLSSHTPRHFLPNNATITPTEAIPATGFDPGTSVIMIGRLTRQKDPGHFADVAEIVHAYKPNISFRWIGDGDPAIRADLESRGVQVTGWLNGDELASELSRPSVYFHSAGYEGFPLSVLDAAAFEHPVVARHVPAFDGMSILQVRSTTEAAAALLDVFAGGRSRDSATTGSRDLFAMMSPEKQRDALDNLYARLHLDAPVTAKLPV